jgi:hypothetical protein
MYVAVEPYGCCKTRLEDVAHVAYVANGSEACCKSLFKMFHFVSKCVVASVLLIWMLHGVFSQVFRKHVFECLSYFIRMLQVFNLDVSEVDLVLQLMFQKHVSSAFRLMLQVLHPDVSKVDRVLHICLHFSTVSYSPRCLSTSSWRPSPSF